MGQAKKFLQEFESNTSIIEGLLILFNDDKLEDFYDPEIIKDLYTIKEMTNNLRTMSGMAIISEIFSDVLYESYKRLNYIIEDNEPFNRIPDEEKRNILNLIRRLKLEVRNIKNKLRNFHIEKQTVYNSEEFYHNQIEELEKQKEELQEFLIHQQNLQGRSTEEIALRKKEIEEKEIELIQAKEQIKSFQKELEEKKKQENAVSEWNSKIKTTFTELTNYLSPIKNEHSRLNVMFWIYTGLIVVSIIFIAFLEIKIFCKLNETKEFPDWKNYFAAIVPIPILGALLWAFIIQINRTQRQLIIIAKHIHEIRYIEGLLLSLNSLSNDINDSAKRVNIAIERLIDNHLNASSKEIINEDSILKEEKKDVIPYELVVKLLNDFKDLTNKK